MDKQPTSKKSFHLVDPNDFTELSNVNTTNSYNTFVPIEDLNILVELTTHSKARSLLTLTNEGGNEKLSTDEQ